MNRFLKTFIISFLFLPLVLNNVSSEEPNLEMIDNLSSAFEKVANQIKPSVVGISSIKKAKKVNQLKRGNRRSPFGSPFNSPFDDFFNDDFFNRFFEIPEGGFSQQGAGSGLIVSEDGLIVTNNHVIHGADEIEVTLVDEKKYPAKLIGTDPKTDIAVIKIEQKGLKPANLGNSDKLKVGQWVIASGSPFNLEHTITAGIVSAKGRSNVGISDYEDFIQTDAAINPGNSGGPLVNLKGEVIGINTAIFSKSGGYMGIGFAIPSNMVRSVMDSLINEGEVVRGFLGVLIQKLDENLAKSFGYEGTQGALVSEITKDSPAAKAGFEEGDIIIEFNGAKISDPVELKNTVGKTKPDQNVIAKVFRNGKIKNLNVKVAKLESAKEEIEKKEDKADNDKLGIDITDITNEIRERLKLDSNNGVVVTYVDPSGPASLGGILRGDIILSVNGEDVSSTKQFNKVMGKADIKTGVRLLIRRQGSKVYLFIKE